MKDKKKLLMLTAAGFSCDFLSPKFSNGDKLTTSFLTNLIKDFEYFSNYVFNSLSENFSENLDIDSYLLDCKRIIDKYEVLYNESVVKLNHEDKLLFNFEHLIFMSELISDSEYSFQGSNRIENKLKAIVLSNKIDVKFSVDDILKIKSLILSVIEGCFKIEVTKIELLKEFYKKILNKLDLKYHTLNYDLVFEQVLDFYDNKNWNKNEDGFYYFNHLHGQTNLFSKSLVQKSLEWRTGQVYFSEGEKIKGIQLPKHTSDEPKHTYDMITGLDKTNKMLNDHYSLAYQKFILDAFSSDILLIIGYSFGDSHINSVLRTTIMRFRKIIIVDYIPEESLSLDSIESKIIIMFFGNIWNDKIETTPSIYNLNELDITDVKKAYYFNYCNIEFEFHFGGAVKYFQESLFK